MKKNAVLKQYYETKVPCYSRQCYLFICIRREHKYCIRELHKWLYPHEIAVYLLLQEMTRSKVEHGIGSISRNTLAYRNLLGR